MKSTFVSFQLGKQKLNNNFISMLNISLKKHELIKISVLKSCCRDRAELKELADTICAKLSFISGKKITAKIVGYVFFIRKWRK